MVETQVGYLPTAVPGQPGPKQSETVTTSRSEATQPAYSLEPYPVTTVPTASNLPTPLAQSLSSSPSPLFLKPSESPEQPACPIVARSTGAKATLTCNLTLRSPIRTVRLENSTPIVCAEFSLTAC